MTDLDTLDARLNAMLPTALQLVGAVRARDPQWVASVVNPLSSGQVMALLIAVAALVPDDQSADQLTLWSHGPAIIDQAYGQLVVDDLNDLQAKECKVCHQTLFIEEFYLNPTRSDPSRRESRCKWCRQKAARDRREAEKAAGDTSGSAVPACSPDPSGEAVKAA